MRLFFLPASTLMFAGLLSFQSVAQQKDKTMSTWAYDSIHIPVTNVIDTKSEPIIVAVVDDAFRLSHKELKEFIYKNPIEIPGNQLDDDGNNYTDDVFGWDISDNDNDVSVPEGRDKEFFHGTYIASIITKVASLHYGNAASDRIKIMPVKVLSDQAGASYLKDGYRGIKYATDNGADIICLAWSGGNPGADDLKIIQDAYKKGILIISSVGNFKEEKILNPALLHEVLAVSGIQMTGQKDGYSNYGPEADISAPAYSVRGAHPEKDNAYITDDGTSASAALVTGCAAVIMSKNKDYRNTDIKDILLNSSTPFKKNLITYGGKLGAGIVNLEKALNYSSEPSNRYRYFSSLRSKGSVYVDKDNALKSWEIYPFGAYYGFYLEPDISQINRPDKFSLNILVNDTIWNSYTLSNIPHKLFVPSSSFVLKMQNKAFKKSDILKINYYSKTIDSSKLYCSGTRYINQERGTIDDGSGEKNYSNNCSCKWIITVSEGKRIKFTFEQLDTQANVDFVNLVDGQTAIPENFFAKLSGQNKPPVVISKTNEVLVWFVSDKFLNGQGWELQYEAID